MIPSAMHAGLGGMQTGYQGMARAADQIARSGVAQRAEGDVSGRTITESLVDLKTNLNLFNASAKIVSASDTMTGSLINLTV